MIPDRAPDLAPTSRTRRVMVYIEGQAQTAGSKRAVPTGAGSRVIESGSKEARDRKAAWRADLREGAKRALNESPAPWDRSAPFVVTMTFIRRRPSSHFGRKGGIQYLKPSAEKLRPTSRPDLLKHARAVEDALTGILWDDDAQITEEHLKKLWGDTDVTLVEVEPIE